ncbi:MAG: FRG domain-containing protein [Anaerolineae bacterium]|nr:FRG domain-containing protein [Anaerolineae bacterium]NUQ05807.1 FRG domain-containing protein [Anaerolineae bacterium]
MDIRETQCNSWSAFKNYIVQHCLENGFLKRGRFLFRGHRDSSWNLKPTFDREFEHIDPAKKSETAELLLTEFKHQMEIAGENIGKWTEPKLTALAQHHGVPTRLLDWTESPYIAAFFAFSEALSRGEIRGNIAVWILDAASHIWNGSSGVSIETPELTGNQRLINQQGRFTLSRTPFGSLEEFHAACIGSEPALTRVIVPRREARLAISDLDLMGIDHHHLFPGFDGAAKATCLRVALKL